MSQSPQHLVRFGIAVPGDLLENFDNRVEKSGFPNRSEAIRQLIREYIMRETWQKESGSVYGTITMTYNHHACDVTGKLTSLQHDFGDVIVCTTHVHVTHESCLEVLIVRGPVARMKDFITELRSLKAINTLAPVLTGIAASEETE